MSLGSVRRMAAQIMDIGEKRVVFDDSQVGEIGKAVTKDDVRKLIAAHAINPKKKKGVPRKRGRARTVRRRLRGLGAGGRKGTANARTAQKTKWIARVRAQRALLKQLKEDGKLTQGYRDIYWKIKGGAFADKARMVTYLKERGYMK